ncbi:hypothetical protein ACH5RR_028916 [Cinchona calisaya]|uniref:Wound-responsive family protein n=1 Tax=Cinchona calisaya TaxID=153742 RepID=A0ABD2YU22_9GENT
MSSTSRAAAAVCVGAVQAMKDQGLCRWNYTLRSLQQHAKSNIGSLSQSSKQLSSSVASTCKAKDHQENLKKSEESLRKVINSNVEEHKNLEDGAFDCETSMPNLDLSSTGNERATSLSLLQQSIMIVNGFGEIGEQKGTSKIVQENNIKKTLALGLVKKDSEIV